MEHCPTCNAPYKDRPDCHRCGTDLTRLAAIGQEAAEQREKAITAFDQKDFQAMYIHARRACSLLRTPSSEKLLACAALAAGDLDSALKTWKRLQKSSSTGTAQAPARAQASHTHKNLR